MTDDQGTPDLPAGDVRDISPILDDWPLESGTITARRFLAEDGTEQIQLRIPMGLLQLCADGRPDGSPDNGFASVFSQLRHQADTEHRAPTPDQWFDLDREIMQYYHRRIALLSLAEAERRERMLDQAAADYARVVRDADHNLAVMDFIREQSTDTEFVNSHDQYRAFVLGHRTLGAGLYWICRNQPEEALDAILLGLRRMEHVYQQRGDIDVMRRDPTAGRLVRLADQLRKDFSIARTLHEQLADAVAAEDFEKAVRLRDQIRDRATQLNAPFKA